jgi:two-component system, cell cycle sensor histidine kinase and response regulator CckA
MTALPVGLEPSLRWKLGLLFASVLVPPSIALALGGDTLLLIGSVAVAGGLGLLFARQLAAMLREATADATRWREEIERIRQRDRITEDALHHCTDVMRSIVSALPVGVVAINRQAYVELWNHAAEAILGYTAEEMVGQPAPTQVFMSSDDDPGAAGPFLRMVTGELVKSEEVRCHRKDGSVVEVSFSGAPLMSADDRIQGAICVFEDLTHRKSLTRALHQAQKMEAVGQLTGGLAHDFNNILGVAIGNLDLLDDEVADRPVAADLVKSALGALLRGADLTRALLAFSRRQPLRPILVNVGSMLRGATKVFRRVLGEQISIALEVDEDLWRVEVDPAQLESAVTNLAINARDAMPEGGRLTIAAHNRILDKVSLQVPDLIPGDFVCIEITDTGTGMSNDVVAHAFEPFFTTKPVGQGTGLGLSMVYGFTKQSGGHVKVYSEPGHGTSVRLYLPRASAPAVEAAPQAPAEAMPRGGNETILVVDDNAEVRRMVGNQLTNLGYRVVEADHGADALAMLEAQPSVELLFTDIVMPQGMNGFALAEEARKRRPGLKVVFTSGFPGSAMQAEGKFPQSTNFLGKPYRRQELACMVRKALDSKG